MHATAAIKSAAAPTFLQCALEQCPVEDVPGLCLPLGAGTISPRLPCPLAGQAQPLQSAWDTTQLPLTQQLSQCSTQGKPRGTCIDVPLCYPTPESIMVSIWRKDLVSERARKWTLSWSFYSDNSTYALGVLRKKNIVIMHGLSTQLKL